MMILPNHFVTHQFQNRKRSFYNSKLLDTNTKFCDYDEKTPIMELGSLGYTARLNGPPADQNFLFWVFSELQQHFALTLSNLFQSIQFEHQYVCSVMHWYCIKQRKLKSASSSLVAQKIRKLVAVIGQKYYVTDCLCPFALTVHQDATLFAYGILVWR